MPVSELGVEVEEGGVGIVVPSRRGSSQRIGLSVWLALEGAVPTGLAPVGKGGGPKASLPKASVVWSKSSSLSVLSSTAVQAKEGKKKRLSKTRKKLTLTLVLIRD